MAVPALCFLRGHQLVGRDGRASQSFSRGVINCVCNGRARAGDSNFANAARPNGVELRIGNVQRRNIDFADVGIGQNWRDIK